MLQHFLENVETFSNGWAGGKIKRRLFRWTLMGVSSHPYPPSGR
jgi:hypothetical protein